MTLVIIINELNIFAACYAHGYLHASSISKSRLMKYIDNNDMPNKLDFAGKTFNTSLVPRPLSEMGLGTRLLRHISQLVGNLTMVKATVNKF